MELLCGSTDRPERGDLGARAARAGDAAGHAGPNHRADLARRARARVASPRHRLEVHPLSAGRVYMYFEDQRSGRLDERDLDTDLSPLAEALAEITRR